MGYEEGDEDIVYYDCHLLTQDQVSKGLNNARSAARCGGEYSCLQGERIACSQIKTPCVAGIGKRGAREGKENMGKNGGGVKLKN